VRGPTSEYAAPPIYVTPEGRKPGIRFSGRELFQLAVAVLALSGALTLLYVLPLLRGGLPVDLLAFLFVASLVAVGTGVGLHEIAHKAVAQRYGHWAEFRYYPLGLLLAFVFAFMGFIYGAPGATIVAGNVRPDENGKISAAGPATNLVLAGGFLALGLALEGAVTTLNAVFLVYAIATSAAFMNLILAGFNMIPFLPFDGAKVWAWNKPAYLGIIAAVLGLFGFGVTRGLFL